MIKWLGLSILVVTLDQITKRIAETMLVQFAPVPVLPFLNLSLVYNQGAAFSFLSSAGGWQRWFLVALALGVSGFIIWWLRQFRSGEFWTPLSLSLILGGAIGNVIDRIWHGHVVDFIDLHYAGYHWPVFNLADSAITVGALMLVFIQFTPPPKGSSRTTS